MGALRTTLTMEEFLQLPELPAGKRELLRGELIELPPSKFRHDEIADRLCDLLKDVVKVQRLGGRVFHEIGYQMGSKHWLKPDVSITHRDQPVDEYLQGAPLLAIEIVSPANTAEEIESKIADYLAFGAAEVWVIYPESRHLWVYAPDISAQCHKGAFLAQVLDGYRIELDQILGD